MLTLLFFAFTFPVVGQEIDSVKTTKNQIDLDVHFLGLECSYKTKITDKIFGGIGVGGGFLGRIGINNNGVVEVFKSKMFVDYYFTKMLHLQFL